MHIPRPIAVAAGIACLTAFAAPRATAALRLAEGGIARFVIVTAAEPTAAERYAAEELTNFLHQATGAAFPIVSEAEHADSPAIHLGWTAFAARQGIEPGALGQEEWVLRAAGSDLILTGGRPRGTLYATYEFLEAVLGLRFLDPYRTHVPELTAWTIPADLDLRGAPALSRREIYMVCNGVGASGSDDWLRFQVRRKLNSFANAWRDIDARYGYAFMYGSPYTTHTHHRYVKDFPELFDNPEFFALTARGRRHPSQPCMSHPEVRRRFATALREYIRRDREALQAAGRGADSFPRHYSLVPDDGTDGKCGCERCLALAEKHGSYAGVVLDFANAVAGDIGKTHPEIQLVTGAYLYYRDFPSGIRPRDNVLVSIAQLPANYNTQPLRDHMRPLQHPLNRGPREEWERWSTLCPRLGVHDYWNHPYPRTLAADLKFYHALGLQHFFTENILLGTHLHHFADLQFYLASRLFQDPGLDSERLITEFTDLYYGPAAAPLRALLEHLERRREEERQPVSRVPVAARAFYDPAYFRDASALLRQAEELAAGDPRRLDDIRLEYLPLDRLLLTQWHALEKAAGADWPFDRAQVLERLEANFERAYRKYGGWGAVRREADEQELAFLRNMPPVPERFADREIIDLVGPRLRLSRGRRVPNETVPDPEAASGRTWRLGRECAGHQNTPPPVLQPVDHARAPEFGLSDAVSAPKFLLKKVLTPEEIPSDEQYHWHTIGQAQMTPNLYFYAHASWIFDQSLRPFAYNAALPDQKTYAVHVSLKLEGPAYVPGSTRENAFSIDRIILEDVTTDP